MARDYKNAKRGGKTSSKSGGFLWGLSLGLAIAGGVHLYDRYAKERQKTAQSENGQTQRNEQHAAASQNAAPPTQFDFYETLPKFEVVVPEKNKGHAEKPASYMLQAGSYRNLTDADHVRALLALQGVESKVVKAQVGNDTWHRIVVGPIRDLKNLDETRRKLREAQIDAMVIRVNE